MDWSPIHGSYTPDHRPFCVQMQPPSNTELLHRLFQIAHKGPDPGML